MKKSRIKTEKLRKIDKGAKKMNLITEERREELREFLTDEEIEFMEMDMLWEQEMMDDMTTFELIGYKTCFYDFILDEIESDLAFGELQLNDTVQVLRADEEISDTGIYPIVHWFYDDKRQTRINEHYPTVERIYLENEDKMEKMTAFQFLAEITTFVKLFNPDVFYEKISTDEDLESTFKTLKDHVIKDDNSQLAIAEKNHNRRKRENETKRKVRKIIKREID
ncbi:MAG: hypothetical protein Q4P29_07360 [Tissierellia bacterium]|nr:hypothetical protein [Tissierellia bacterium]